MRDAIPFVDLFCGAGGLSAGFEQAGFRAAFANDIDEFAVQTYSYNHPTASVHAGGVESLTAKMIRDRVGSSRIPLVVGGPNCQGVSLRGKRDPDDPKNLMFFHYKRLIGELKPDWFVMENVPGLLHRHNRQLVTDIFAAFNDIGYRCGGEVLLAADYGVPQLRYRFILIGNKHGLPVRFPAPTHQCPLELDDAADLFNSTTMDESLNGPGWLTVKDAISDLPEIENGGGAESMKYPSKAESEYQRLIRRGSRTLYNHQGHLSPENNVALIKHIPQGKNWKAIPEELRPKRFRHVALKDHTTTFGRLSWNMPARTVTTYFNNISAGAFTHPEQHRGISVREGARLQSFPDAFRFFGPLSRQYRQVGNAVPCGLAAQVASQIRLEMEGGASQDTHEAAVDYSPSTGNLTFKRPVKGMRFNLDRYLVRS